jgi:hypothetical protein
MSRYDLARDRRQGLISLQVGTVAGISNDVENLKVNRGDFMMALDEVHPAFGVAEEELQQVVQNGIIHYDTTVDVRNTYFHSWFDLHAH